MTAISGPTILLATGRYFSFSDPMGSKFGIHDVAAALSKLCRFTGHTTRFYSVAEHSVWVSRIVRPSLALEGLLHDAPEAFIGDVAAPLKALLPDYRALEARITAAVHHRFDLPAVLSPEVKIADRSMLVVEQAQAMRNADVWVSTADVPHPDVLLQFWSPEEAQRRFLERFAEISG
jgi:uncharacterized protein